MTDSPDPPDRTVDTAWLLAAAMAMRKEFEHRLKMDSDFKRFAAILASLNAETARFMRPRMHLGDEDQSDDEEAD